MKASSIWVGDWSVKASYSLYQKTLQIQVFGKYILNVLNVAVIVLDQLLALP